MEEVTYKRLNKYCTILGVLNTKNMKAMETQKRVFVLTGNRGRMGRLLNVRSFFMG